MHARCFCQVHFTDSFSSFFFSISYFGGQHYTIQLQPHFQTKQKKQLELKCATHFTAFYGCIATMLGSDNNLYPTDHRVFEPSNNQQWKHSICCLISCSSASKPYIVLDPGPPDSYAFTQSCLDYKVKEKERMYSQWDFLAFRSFFISWCHSFSVP